MKKRDINSVSIVVEPAKDNVAVALCTIEKNTVLSFNDKDILILEDIGIGERFAIDSIPKGNAVVQYGYPFGISKGIKIGELISNSNISSRLQKKRFKVINPVFEKKRSEYEDMTFKGYLRSNGKVGTRNYYLIVPTSMCASATAILIAKRFSNDIKGVDGVVAIPNTEGCGCAGGMQIDRYLTVIRNFVIHPNAGAALLIDLGCEQTNAKTVRNFFENTGVSARDDLKIDWLTIQKEGGVARTVKTGEALIKKRISTLCEIRRKDCSIGNLVIGAECGASDAFSGISANRVIGNAIDKVIYSGGSAIMSEIPEMRGAEHYLIARMKNRQTVSKFKSIMRWYEHLAKRLGYTMDDNLVPENKAGGLFNPYIKSLGAVMKGGTTPIEGILEYGEEIQNRGLHIMQGPGNDLESVTGLTASGSTIICFSTGRGTVTGSAIVPVIKISSTTDLYNRLSEDIDFDAGAVLRSRDSAKVVDDLGSLLFDKIIDVASGKQTCSELNEQRQFQVWTAGKLSL